MLATRRFARNFHAAPLSANISRNGWVWDGRHTTDENWLDLACLLAKSSTTSKPPYEQVGCCLVSSVENGSARRAEAQGHAIVCGVNSWLFKPGPSDCHAEASAVAESARRGLPLCGATCYVSKPPCPPCFKLLACAGIARIVSPKPMLSALSKAASKLGIRESVLPCSDERKQRRELLASEARGGDRDEPSSTQPVPQRMLRSVVLAQAVDGQPTGFRSAQMPEPLVAAAREELERAMLPDQKTLQMQFSFGAANSGWLRPLRHPRQYPACLALMEEANQRFLGHRRDRDRDLDRIQVMVRKYALKQSLAPHCDSETLFGESVLSVVLRCGPSDGLVLRKQGLPVARGDARHVAERAGVATCLQGPARYDYTHEVPAVAEPRLSLTWRWFRPGSLEELTPAPPGYAGEHPSDRDC